MKKNFVTLIKVSLVLIVFLFIFKFIYNNISELKEYEFTVDPACLILSFICYVSYLVGKSLIWHFITIKNGVNIELNKSIISWFYTMLGRYIPGKVVFIMGRVYFYSKEGKSSKKVAFCFFLEMICGILAAIFILLVSLLFLDIEMFKQYEFSVWILMIVFFIFIHPKILSKIVNFALSVLKRKKITFTITYLDNVKFISLYFFNWLFLGATFYFFSASIADISIKYFLFLTGSYALAAIIGILSLFAPSGVGVREGVLILALKNIFSGSLSTILALSIRIWVTLIEVLCVLFIFGYTKIQKIQFANSENNNLNELTTE